MIRIQRLIGIRPSTRPMRGPLSALGALLALGGATAMAHDPAQSSSADRIAALRQQVEEMQQRLDELRASLEDETQGTEDVVEVRRPRFAFPARVAVRGDGEEECTEEGCEEHEQAKKEVRAVVIDGDDLGEWREWAGKDLEEKIRGHVGHVREHLQHLGHSGDDGEVEVDGEATIEIIIQTDDGPPRHIKKQIPIDGNGFKMLWRGDDEEGEDGDHPMRFDWSDGSPQHWKLGGHPFLFQHGDEDDGERKVHVLELNKLLDESTDSEDLEKIEKIIGGRVEELLQTHGQGLEHGIGDHEHLLKLHELLEKKLHGKLEDKVKVKVLPKLKVLKHGEDVPVLIEVRPDDAPEASAGTREVI